MIEKKMVLSVLLFLLVGLILPSLFGTEPKEIQTYYVEASIFSGELKGSELSQKIPEDQITIIRLTPMEKDNTLLQQIKKSFNEDLMQISGEAKGRFLISSDDSRGKTNWMANDFVIKINMDTPPQPVGSGRILMFETNKGLNYVKEFQLEADTTVLTCIRNKKKLVLVSLQIEKAEELSHQIEDAFFHTVYHTENKTCVIYSKDSGWDGESFKAAEILFNEAKAVIQAEKGEVILKAEKIRYSKKDNMVIGFNAILTDQDGKIHGENSQITVSLDKPMDFKIK